MKWCMHTWTWPFRNLNLMRLYGGSPYKIICVFAILYSVHVNQQSYWMQCVVFGSEILYQFVEPICYVMTMMYACAWCNILICRCICLLSVAMGTDEECRESHYLRLEERSGYLATFVTENSPFGSVSCPWVIQVSSSNHRSKRSACPKSIISDDPLCGVAPSS